MKKVFLIFIFIILLFSLSGCSKYKYNKFNENLDFDEKLSDEEIEEVTEQALKNWNNFSTLKMRSDSYYNTNNSYSKIKNNLTVKAFSNSLIQASGTSKSEYDRDGSRIKENEKIEVYAWDCEEDNAIVQRELVNGETRFYVIKQYKENEDNHGQYTYQYVFEAIRDLLPFLFKSFEAYKTNNGYIFFMSERNEMTRQWKDDDSREVYSLNEMQLIVLMNKKCEITEILEYYTTTSNQDPDTREWYDKNVKYRTIAIQIKISYGKQKENTKIVEELNEGYKEYKERKRGE